MIFQAFGNGIPAFEVPWPFAAIFLPTDSESFALAMEINKTKMSKRRGKKHRFRGGEKGLGEEYFQRQRVMGKICCLTGKQIFNHARHGGVGRFLQLGQPKAYLVMGVCEWVYFF